MVLPYLSAEDDGQVRRCFIPERKKVRHLGEPVDDYPELVASF